MLVNGKISTVKISSQDPQWAFNFKKAQVESLKIQLPAQGMPSFWAVMEQGIEGAQGTSTMNMNMELSSLSFAGQEILSSHEGSRHHQMLGTFYLPFKQNTCQMSPRKL